MSAAEQVEQRYSYLPERWINDGGFTILQDIVALAPDNTLVLAEVRLRSRQDYGGGAASVDHRKQQRLLRAGRHLLATHPHWSGHALRFDVLDVRRAEDSMEIRWIQHAFEA